MRFHFGNRAMPAAFVLLVVGVTTLRSEDAPKKPAAPAKTVERGLAFLVSDAVKWRTERKCASCHHGTMTVWALSEAKRQGYAVDDKARTEFVTWTKERLKDVDKPRDTRPGWSM